MASAANGGAENGSEGLDILGKKLELTNRLAESRSPYVSLALTSSSCLLFLAVNID